MAGPEPSHEDRAFQVRAIQISIRIALIAILAFWSFRIVEPFIDPVLWGAIIAIATQPLYRRIRRWLGDRKGLAAALLVVLGLLLIIGPAVALGTNLVQTASYVADELHEGVLAIPAPPDSVQDWPIVGDKLYSLWAKASRNIGAGLEALTPYFKDIALWLLNALGATGVGFAKFVLSIVIAGVFLANGERAVAAATAVATRLTGERGPGLTRLVADTVQSVTRGVLGVALIQSLLAGLGMLVLDVPAAGLWALLVLILAVVQLPPTLVLVPVVVYVFFHHSTPVAVLFAIWNAVVGFGDTPLRAWLMGKASHVPTLVIFVGAIGGLMFRGLIGLFLGAVILALGYTLLLSWVEEEDPDEAVRTQS